MGDPVNVAVMAAADIGAMGDKVAAFAITQNLLWTIATVKDGFRPWLGAKRRWFIGGAVAAGAVYVGVEMWLGIHARELICSAGCGPDKQRVLEAIDLLFSMRALGAVASSAVAALAFWGTTRPPNQPSVSSR